MGAIFIQNLPYFIGTTDYKEAERIIRSGEQDYVLREKEKEGLRLTVKDPDGR